MILKTILSVSGKPGLYRLISQTKSLLIAEALTDEKKRTPIYPTERVVSLGDIAIYTNNEEVPLEDVLMVIKERYNGERLTLDIKKGEASIFSSFMEEVLPEYDKERVRLSDIKKLVQWYNILSDSGVLLELKKQD